MSSYTVVYERVWRPAQIISKIIVPQWSHLCLWIVQYRRLYNGITKSAALAFRSTLVIASLSEPASVSFSSRAISSEEMTSSRVEPEGWGGGGREGGRV